jgi:selenocysteine lyase/cysteine desulfurase
MIWRTGVQIVDLQRFYRVGCLRTAEVASAHSTIGCFGLRAALEFLLEVGVEEIGPAVQALDDRIDAGTRARGYETMREHRPETGAGIVSFRKPAVDAVEIVNRLRARGIAAARAQDGCAHHRISTSPWKISTACWRSCRKSARHTALRIIQQ